MKKLFIILIALFYLAGFSFVSAAEEKLSLTVTPPLIKINISPGEVWSSSVKIVNNNPRDLQVFASVMDFKSGQEGGIVFIRDKDSLAGEKFLLSQWIEISSDPILIPAYQSRQVPFRINVPLDAEPGGKYATILVGTGPATEDIPGTGIRISTLVSSLILANVRGEVIEAARIREFSTEKTFYQEPEVRFTLRMENTGNVHIQPQGEIRIFNFWGKERGMISINHKTEYGNVLPQSVRKWNFTWQGEESLLEAGRYKAVLTLFYGNEAKQTVTRTVYFWVVPLVPTVGILGGIFLFFAFTFLMIRIYIRRAVFLAQKEAATSPGVRLPPRVLIRKIASKTVDSLAPADFQKKRPKTSIAAVFVFWLRKYFIAFLVVMVFISGLIAASYYFKDVLKETREFEVIIEEEAGLPAMEVPQEIKMEAEEKVPLREEEIVEEIDKRSFSIKILNGSGIRGEAAKIAENLKNQNFQITDVANADNFNYQETLINYKKGKEKEAEFLNQFFNGRFKLTEVDIQQEDLVIIIGRDFSI